MDNCASSAADETNIDNAGKSLLDFDDLVLSKIMKNLTIIDLANLGETCTRLQNLTQDHFAKYHSSVSWMNYRDEKGNTILPSECERVFKHIGKHVRSIKLTLWADFEFYEILVILAQQCRQIESLFLDSIRMSRPLTLCDPLISLLFSKLKRFVLTGCFWMGWCPLDIFFGYNSTLEDLSVINCCAYNGYGYRLQLGGFTALKQLRLLRCRNVITEKELQVCFEQNSIESLVLCDIGNVNIFLENVIDGLCDTVDDLSLDFSDEINADQLLRLKKLRALRLHCRVCSDVDSLLQKLGADNQIEELVITKMLISSETIEALKNFTKLTRLRLDQTINSVPRQFFRALPKILPQLEHFVYAYSTIRDEDIIFMVKSMRKLNRLSFFGCNPLAEKTYQEMAQILANDWQRPKLELIPPKFETLKSLEALRSMNDSIWLRTDICHKGNVTTK